MANIEKAIEKASNINIKIKPTDQPLNEYQINLRTCIQSYLLEVLEAMREPALPVDDRAITRGQADEINRRQTELFKQINDIQSIISGTKRKWRDEVDRRLDNLEGNITKDNNGDLIRTTIGNTAEPAPTKDCGCLVGSECARDNRIGKNTCNGDKKPTIEIDRELVIQSLKQLNRFCEDKLLIYELKRALAGGK